MTLRQRLCRILETQGYSGEDTLKLRFYDEFSWVVGLGDPRRSKTPIPLWLGVRHEGVQALIADLMQLPDDGFDVVTGTNLGYVLGQGFRFEQEPTTAQELADRLADGERILSAYCRLDALPAIFDEIRGTTLPLFHFQLVAIHMLLGDQQGVDKWLAVAERVNCKHPGPLTDQFRRFEARVRERLPEFVGPGTAE